MFFWAVALDAVLLEVLAAFLFLGLTPVTSVLFGLFASSMNAARAWLQLFARAMLAIILTFGLGVLWYQWFGPTPNAQHYASGFAAGTLMLLGHAGTPVLGVGLYVALAFVLWVLWLRPLLLVTYHVVAPIAAGVLKGGATTAALGAHFSPRGKGEAPGDTALGHAATALAAAGDAVSGPAVQRVLTFGVGGALDQLSNWQNPAAGM